MSTRWQYRNKIHEEIVKRLLQTSRLPGFSGSLFHGKRQGRDPSLHVDVPAPFWMTSILGIQITQVEIDDMEDDEVTVGDNDLGVDVDTDAFISLLEDVSLH